MGNWCARLSRSIADLAASIPRGARQLTPAPLTSQTSRQQIPSASGANNAHIRRKSVIPLDASVLKELASHRSLDDVVCVVDHPWSR